MNLKERMRLAKLSIGAGGAVILHQLIMWGRIDVADVLHHEFFGGVLIAFGLGAYWLGRK